MLLHPAHPVDLVSCTDLTASMSAACTAYSAASTPSADFPRDYQLTYMRCKNELFVHGESCSNCCRSPKLGNGRCVTCLSIVSFSCSCLDCLESLGLFCARRQPCPDSLGQPCPGSQEHLECTWHSNCQGPFDVQGQNAHLALIGHLCTQLLVHTSPVQTGIYAVSHQGQYLTSMFNMFELYMPS